MAGINDTDIRLNESWQLTAAATGDAPTCSDLDCFIQDVQLEAISMENELFYAPEWGWGLIEFLHSEDDSLIRLEISERIKQKLRNRPQIIATTITTQITFADDAIRVDVSFRLVDSELVTFAVNLSRVNVEVKIVD